MRAVEALSHTLIHNAAARGAAAAEGGVGAALSAVRAHAGVDALHAASFVTLQLMLSAAQRWRGSCADAFACGACELVPGAMRARVRSAALQSAGLGVLLELTRDDVVAGMRAAAGGAAWPLAVEAATMAMQAHASERDVQLHACALLERLSAPLAAYPPYRRAALTLCILRAALAAMRAQRWDAAMQAACMSLLINLINDQQLKPTNAGLADAMPPLVAALSLTASVARDAPRRRRCCRASCRCLTSSCRTRRAPSARARATRARTPRWRTRCAPSPRRMTRRSAAARCSITSCPVQNSPPASWLRTTTRASWTRWWRRCARTRRRRRCVTARRRR
jgi:hypothetical protein